MATPMTAQRWILFPLAAAVAMIAVLAGCSSGSSGTKTSPPPPNVSIVFNPVPANPLPVTISSTTTLTAVVTNDPNNYGVDWLLTCSVSGNCGTLNGTTNTVHTDCPTSSSSGCTVSVTYTAPPTLFGDSQPVNIVAYATADHTQNQLAQVHATGFAAGNIMAGNYVLQAQGVDNLGATNYQFAGVISVDGMGNITGGEQTVNFFDQALPTPALVSKTDPITGGSYFLGPDGRGMIFIDTADNDIGFSLPNVAGNGTETFTFVFLNPSHALISQMDLPAPGSSSGSAINTTGASATGTMDLQDAAAITAALSGGYAFVASGSNNYAAASTPPVTPMAMGGVLDIVSSSNISGVIDQVLLGPTPQAPLTVNPAGSISPVPNKPVTPPDAFGQVTVPVTAGFTSGTSTPIQFAGYIVDATHIKLIESDNAFFTAGQAIAQGAATGNFNDASFSACTPQGGTCQSYVFGVLGTDLGNPDPNNTTNPFPSTAPNTLTLAGAFTPDSALNLYGIGDMLLQQWTGARTGIQGRRFGAPYNATYSVDSTGRIPAVTLVQGASSFQPQFYIYLTGNAAPALVLAVGPTSARTKFPLLGTGIAYPQAPLASLTFNGNYGFNFTQLYGATGATVENDGTAQMAVNLSTGKPFSYSLSGAADANLDFVAHGNQDQPFTNDPSVAMPQPPKNGVFHGTLLGTNSPDGTITSTVFINPGTSLSVAENYYFIDGSLGNPGGFLVETDLVTPAGSPSGQVSLGYYAARTSLAATTTTTLTSSPNPSTFGQPVTFTATVTPSQSVTPSGTVYLYDGKTLLTSASWNGSPITFTTSTLEQNSQGDTITALYSGATGVVGSSATLTQTVN